MTVEIRRITQVSDALEEAFARLMPQLSPRLGAPSREVLWRVAGSETGALLAAVAGERIVGVLTLAWYDAPSGRKAWIEDVVVDGAARGCGAGDALVRAAVEHAARIGAGKVMLTSNPAREAARALYRKVGFEEVETTVFAFKTDK
ncbi:N-acetyltransferase [Alistipes finegoldii]|uniref:GNAT family N-acetyltransferase n=1 Tax=Alistipes finegoldii TaxID=214856 RepID=UPI0026DBE793|nr:GNAT family N-acetyltransferase [Alistipes finegoldii]